MRAFLPFALAAGLALGTSSASTTDDGGAGVPPPADVVADATGGLAALPGRCAELDTLRVVANPAPPEIEELRDPREEPLFVEYAKPVQLMGLADRLDLDRVRWRYGVGD